MKQIEETSASMADKLRYIVAGVLLVVAVVGYYALAEQALVVRVLLLIAGVAVSVGLVWGTQAGLSARKHLQATHREVKQVVWPTREQAIRMTLIVFAAVAMVGLFLWLVDMFFLWGVQTLTGRGE